MTCRSSQPIVALGTESGGLRPVADRSASCVSPVPVFGLRRNRLSRDGNDGIFAIGAATRVSSGGGDGTLVSIGGLNRMRGRAMTPWLASKSAAAVRLPATRTAPKAWSSRAWSPEASPVYGSTRSAVTASMAAPASQGQRPRGCHGRCGPRAQADDRWCRHRPHARCIGRAQRWTVVTVPT